MIELSVIVPWKMGNPVREESLRNMLNCIKVQRDVPYELIIVEQTTPQKAEASGTRIKEIVPQELASFKYFQLINETTSFNKSWCMNVGARNSRYSHLLFLDADSLFGPDYFSVVVKSIETIPESHNKALICWNWLVAMPGKDNPIVRYIQPYQTRAMGGIWYANKDFYFNTIGGMNENFLGYGGEDNEAYERVCHALDLSSVSYIAYTLVHQYHDWEKPYDNVVKLFEIGREHPGRTSNRLKAACVGQIDKPTFIEMS